MNYAPADLAFESILMVVWILLLLVVSIVLAAGYLIYAVIFIPCAIVKAVRR